MSTSSENGVPLADFIRHIKSQLLEAVAARDPKEPALALEKVKLEMDVQSKVDSSVKGGVKFWVINADAARTAVGGTTQKVTLELSPAEPMFLGREKTASALD